MKIKDLKALLSYLEDDEEVYIRYGKSGMISDVGLELVCDDNGIGDFILLCSNGRNIQTTGMDGE